HADAGRVDERTTGRRLPRRRHEPPLGKGYWPAATETRRPSLPTRSYTTWPSTRAKSVWSRASATPCPGRMWLPRWRTRIAPALTDWSPKTFTPRRWAFEFRPLREEPPPFLSA